MELTHSLTVLNSNPPESGECTYSAPSVAAWAAVSVAVTSPKLRTYHCAKTLARYKIHLLAIPRTSGYTAIGLGVASVLTVIIKVSIRYF